MSVETKKSGWWGEFYDESPFEYFLLTKTEEEIEATTFFLIEHLYLKPGFKVFDQCCGIGTVAIPLASRNFEIIGVDLCERYIKLANEKSRAANLSAKFFADDAFSFKTNTLCDAAFNWWTSFGYSDSDDKNLEMLKRAADSLRSGARFALDIPNAEFIRAKKNTSDVSSIETSMGTVSILRDTELQLDAQSRRQIWTFTMPDGSQKVYHTALRLYEPAAIQKLLIDAGFCDFELYGGVKNEQLSAEIPRCIVVSTRN
jgi:SAM-dependent methyltransferase